MMSDPFAQSIAWQMDAAGLERVGIESDYEANAWVRRSIAFLEAKKAERRALAALMPEPHHSAAHDVRAPGAPCWFAPAGCQGHIAPNERSGALRCDACWWEP